jgi:hypothetical protein
MTSSWVRSAAGGTIGVGCTNVDANPDGEIIVSRRTLKMRSRIATDDGHDRLFASLRDQGSSTGLRRATDVPLAHGEQRLRDAFDDGELLIALVVRMR